MRIAGTINWIAELPHDARRAIEARFEYRNLASGEVLGETGQPCEGMYQVQSGYVKLLGDQPDGERALLAIYIPGNCFCESPVIDGRPHHHTTIAAGPARIGVLKKADFDELYNQHPSIPEALCRKLASTLSSLLSYRETQNQTTVAQRVALVLHNLAEISQTPRLDRYKEIDVPITISELSTFLGLTRQTIQKEISQLKRRNVITKLPGNWAVREMNVLAGLARTQEYDLQYSD